VLRDENPEYFVVRKDQWFLGATREPHVDRGVYLMLAALTENAAP
jgi:hypothetical protein